MKLIKSYMKMNFKSFRIRFFAFYISFGKTCRKKDNIVLEKQ